MRNPAPKTKAPDNPDQAAREMRNPAEVKQAKAAAEAVEAQMAAAKDHKGGIPGKKTQGADHRKNALSGAKEQLASAKARVEVLEAK